MYINPIILNNPINNNLKDLKTITKYNNTLKKYLNLTSKIGTEMQEFTQLNVKTVQHYILVNHAI